MSEFTGIVSPALQIGFSVIGSKPKRGIYGIKFNDGTTMDDIIPQIVEEERFIDQMEITQHPVEQGASIADHAFKRPVEVTVKFSWSNSLSDGSLVNPAIGLAAINPAIAGIANVAEVGIAAQSLITGSNTSQNDATYQKLLNLQTNRGLFTLFTGKRTLPNMLLKTIALENTFRTENSLHAILTCEQLIIVQSETFDLPANLQKEAKVTASTKKKGVKPARKVN